MPWRSFVNDQFETTQTTDMSTAKLEAMLNEGWREASLLESQLASLCRGYTAAKVKQVLLELIDAADKKHERPVKG